MNYKLLIKSVRHGHDVDAETMEAVMRSIMSGQLDNQTIAEWLTALRDKGETAEEIAAAAKVMRENAATVAVSHPHLIDTCGTGGDGANTFNISTAGALVAAAAGAKVCKHGNRAVSSACGCADLLEHAGVAIELTPEHVVRCLETVGIGFFFAPVFHSAMKHVRQARTTIGGRSIFNLLGPLCNPAGTRMQLIGVFSPRWLEILVGAAQTLGAERIMAVHGRDGGLDEITLGESEVVELRDGRMHHYTISSQDFGMDKADLEAVRVADADESLALIKRALKSDSGAAHDLIALNAGAAIYIAGCADDLAAGVERAREVLKNGAGLERLYALAECSRRPPS